MPDRALEQPLSEPEIKEKIRKIDDRIRILALSKIKYLNDLKYYTDLEYRERETNYKEKSLSEVTEQAI